MGLIFIAYKGFKNGLVNQFIWLISFLVAYFISLPLCYKLAKAIDIDVYSERLTIILSFVLLYFIVILLFYKFGDLITKVLNLTILGVVNSILGAVLNGLIYIVLMVSVVAILLFAVPKVEKYSNKTIIAKKLVEIEYWVMDVKASDMLKKYINKL